MSAAGWLIRHRLRRRRAALGALTAIAALGFGGALVAIGAAERTRGAYGAFLVRSDVGDVTVNPALLDREVDALMRGLDGVQEIAHDAMFLAGIDDGHPRTLAEFLAEPQHTLVRGSPDGRGTVLDRPVYAEGRPIAARDEALVTREVAADRGLQVGDDVRLSFWSSSMEFGVDPDEIVRPIGVETLRVVGIVTLSDEVLADDLFPRGQVIVSPEVTTTYDCLPSLPPVDVTFEEASRVLLPEGCATSYPYYSLDLEGGPDAVPATLATLSAEMERLNERVPTALVEFGAVHAVIATTTADEQQRVERSVQPTVAALGVLGLGTAAVTLVVTGLAVARDLRRSAAEIAVWRLSGMTAAARAGVLLAPAALASLVGLAVGVAGAWTVSPLAPVGAVRRVDPSPNRAMSEVVLAITLALAVVTVAVFAALALRAARRAGSRGDVDREARLAPRFLRSSSSPAVSEGLRAAWSRNRGAGLVAASGGVAVGVLLAAVVFGGTLDTVLATPTDYGWRWDSAILGGYGYGRQDLEAIRASLADRDDVARWDALAIAGYAVDGEPVVGLSGFAEGGRLELTLVTGRMPTGPREVALGGRTAAAIGAEVGDVVALEGDLIEPTDVLVTGIAVLPVLGQYQADRTGPGVGVVVSPELAGVEAIEESITFVGLDLEPEADPAAMLGDLRRDFGDWAVEGDYTFDYRAPVRPPEIVDANAMRTVPLVVGGLLATAAVVGLVSAVVVSVRSRRRELGTLRALGFTGRQLRSTVRVQSLATMAAAMAVGVPLGLVAGRLAWRAFAGRLGIVTDPTTPWPWVVATVIGGLMVAVVAAAVPARLAARLQVGSALRAD